MRRELRTRRYLGPVSRRSKLEVGFDDPRATTGASRAAHGKRSCFFLLKALPGSIKESTGLALRDDMSPCDVQNDISTRRIVPYILEDEALGPFLLLLSVVFFVPWSSFRDGSSVGSKLDGILQCPAGWARCSR